MLSVSSTVPAVTEVREIPFELSLEWGWIISVTIPRSWTGSVIMEDEALVWFVDARVNRASFVISNLVVFEATKIRLYPSENSLLANSFPKPEEALIHSPYFKSDRVVKKKKEKEILAPTQ